MEVFEREKHPEQAIEKFIRDGKLWLGVSVGSVFVVYGLLKAFGLNPNGCVAKNIQQKEIEEIV